MRTRLLRFIRRISPPIIGLALLVTIGTLLFSYLENISLFDAFYWTIVVVSTVGFGDITPHTFGGKLLFMFLVIFGLAFFGYFLSLITSIVAEEKLSKILYGYLLPDGGKRYKEHAVILGWSVLTRYIVQELKANGVRYLIVVDDESLGKKLRMDGYNSVVGNIEDPRFMDSIGLANARAVIVSSMDVSSTIINVLRVRRFSKDVPIIVLSTDPELNGVISEAGATYIVNGYDIIGRLMANYVFEPDAAYVATDLLSKGNLDLVEAKVGEGFTGYSIGDIKARGLKSDIILIRRGDEYIVNPKDDFKLNSGDRVVLIGISDELEADMKLLEA